MCPWMGTIRAGHRQLRQLASSDEPCGGGGGELEAKGGEEQGEKR